MLARRSGDQWYVGGMTNEKAREISFDLDFLEEGPILLLCGKMLRISDTAPAHLVKETLESEFGRIHSREDGESRRICDDPRIGELV